MASRLKTMAPMPRSPSYAFIQHEFCFRCGDHAPQPDGYQARPVILCQPCQLRR